jgi:hypothetical protein
MDEAAGHLRGEMVRFLGLALFALLVFPSKHRHWLRRLAQRRVPCVTPSLVDATHA